VRKHDRTWARNNKEKEEAYADHLEQTFQPHEEKTMDNLRRIEETQIQRIPSITSKETLNAIKVNINPKKALGFDLITGEILKQLPKKAIVKLTYLYNAAFRLKYRVIHKSLRDFRTRLRNNQDRHGREEHIIR